MSEIELLQPNTVSIAVLIILAYLVGSISFSLLMARIFSLGNLRNIGSGNIGTTNVLRTGNYLAASLTLILDLAKGFLPVLAAWFVTQNPIIVQVVGLACFFGHLWPIWHQFRGGKGVATFFGVIFAATPLAGIVVALIWCGVAGIFRIASLASLLSALAYPLVLIILGNFNYLWFAVLALIFIGLKHRPNIQRIFAGKESKIKL